MNLNNYLPRYNKTWSKINSLEPIHHESGGIYLVIKQNNPLIHNGEITHKYLSQFETQATEGLYFFELFKYLKKYQDAIAPKEIANAVNIKHYDADFGLIKHNIKDHLVKKYNKKLSKKLNLTMRFEHLSKYKKFVDHCFDCLVGNQMEINLVIQKRIGYKYYQNIIYK
jgi:hypothetical protein